jgi:hypothetical protein
MSEKKGGKQYGIDDAAKKLGVKAATARALFRKHKIPRKGKPYLFDSVAALNAAVKKVQSAA